MNERPAISRFRTSLLGLMLLAWSVPAQAYELRLFPTTSLETFPAGPVVSFELYLDTQGESNIQSLNVAIGFDDAVLAYRADLSATDGYYPLYAPGSSGKGPPPSWLVPTSDPPALFTGSPPPPLGAQVNIGYDVMNTGPETGTSMTATNVYLATITFAPVRPGSSPILFGFGQGDTTFTLGDGSDIQDQVNALGSVDVFVGPEPGTALLVATGLFVLGRARRHQSERK